MLLAISLLSYTRERKITDTNMGAFDAMHVQEKTIEFMEQHGYYDRRISCKEFLQREHLTDPGSGFRHTSRQFTHVQWDVDEQTEAVVFDNIETNMDSTAAYKNIKNGNFHRVYRAEHGPAHSEIYEKNRK